MYWTNFYQPTVRVQLNVFEQTLIEVGSLNLYASFGTFCVQIGQLFESQWAFEECLNIDKSLFSKHSVISETFLAQLKTKQRKQIFIDVQAFFKGSLWLE